MKNYLTDNGKVRHCARNIAQMNVIEYSRYFLIPRLGKEAWGVIKETGKNIGWGFMGIIGILIMPIATPIMMFLKAKRAIKEAKKECEICDRTSPKNKQKES